MKIKNKHDTLRWLRLHTGSVTISDHREELLDTIATVRGNDLTGNSIFLPRLVELRSDKMVADSYKSVVEQFEMAKLGKR